MLSVTKLLPFSIPLPRTADAGMLVVTPTAITRNVDYCGRCGYLQQMAAKIPFRREEDGMGTTGWA